MQPKLSDSEQEKWNEEGWTPEAVGQVGADILAASLGIKIGRAAAIKAECAKKDESETNILEKALAGDVAAQREISHKTHGLPWVALRGGKPALKEIRALIDDLHKYRTRRATFYGLAVIDISDIAKSKDRLPRCQITGHALDDYDGKLEDGETGADYAKIWIEPRGNGRVLWIANRPDLLPGYAKDDPSRVVSELSNENVPTPYKRLEAAWLSASPVQKAQAEEALFNNPVAVSAMPAGETIEALPMPTMQPPAGEKPLLFILNHPDDSRFALELKKHCIPPTFPARILTLGDIPPGERKEAWLYERLSEAVAVVVVVSADLFADSRLMQWVESCIAARKTTIPYVARSAAWKTSILGSKQPLADGKVNEPFLAAQGLRMFFERTAPRQQAPTRSELRGELNARLKTSADLDVFCSDNFPSVYSRFAAGMDRVERTTLLLDIASPEAVRAALGGGR